MDRIQGFARVVALGISVDVNQLAGKSGVIEVDDKLDLMECSIFVFALLTVALSRCLKVKGIKRLAHMSNVAQIEARID